MNNKMALNLIAEIMGWNESDRSTANDEYAWLRLMSSVKYDGYSDFRAGARFVESLATWLKQFDAADRPAAYNFVKTRLIYVSPAELQRLIESFLPETVTPTLRAEVAAELGIKPYEAWSTAEGVALFRRRLRRTLFVGLSDGSRIDILRRASPAITQEHIIPMMYVDDEKWRDLHKKLQKEAGDGAKFDHVYLVDDFTASGTTFIRQVEGSWTGKLQKFNDIVLRASKELGSSFPIAKDYALHIHHYVSSHQARQALEERLTEANAQWPEKSYGSYEITEGLLLPKSTKMTGGADAAILDLCDRYYDHALFERLEEHCKQAKQTDMKRGYANCALPIIFDHNTPNNSVSLLWAETDGEKGAHAMKPLFHRRDRHG
jgi:hypothetical protein